MGGGESCAGTDSDESETGRELIRMNSAGISRGGTTRMAALAVAIPLLGALWPLMALAIALSRTVQFSV